MGRTSGPQQGTTHSKLVTIPQGAGGVRVAFNLCRGHCGAPLGDNPSYRIVNVNDPAAGALTVATSSPLAPPSG